MTKKKEKKKDKIIPKSVDELIKSEEELINNLGIEENGLAKNLNQESNKEESEKKIEKKEETKEEEVIKPSEDLEKEMIVPPVKITGERQEIKETPLELNIPPIGKIEVKLETEIEEIEVIDYKYYTFNPDTKFYTCKKCEKNYKREGSCLSHCKKIHYGGKDIKPEKKSKDVYVPIMTYKEYTVTGKPIAITMMNFLTYNCPIWVRLMIDRKAISKMSNDRKNQITLFAQKIGTDNQKNLEKTFPIWGKDFYTLLCKLRIFNLIFKIKYLALIQIFVSSVKNTYQTFGANTEKLIAPMREE